MNSIPSGKITPQQCFHCLRVTESWVKLRNNAIACDGCIQQLQCARCGQVFGSQKRFDHATGRAACIDGCRGVKDITDPCGRG